MTRNESKVLHENLNEILNHVSQDSSIFAALPTSPQDNLFSIDPPSFYLELAKKPSLYHAVDSPVL